MKKAIIGLLVMMMIFVGMVAQAAGGDLIVTSDMSISNITIQGNVYVAYGSTLDITGTVNIMGNLYVWGTVNNRSVLTVSSTIYCLHYNNMMHASMDYKCGYFYNYSNLNAYALNVTDSWINTKIPGVSNTPTVPPLPTATPAPSQAPITNDSWSFENGVLTIKINGDMPDYNFTNIPWSSAQRTATKIVVEEGATRIGQCAFYDFGQVSEIVLPSTLRSIGIWAFYGCSNLNSIEIPTGVTKVESWAFSDCMKLKSVSMPDTISNMGLGVFDGANNVTVIVPESAQYVINYCTSSGIPIKKICDSHQEVTDYGYAPTCTTTGLSTGKHCSVCGEVLVPQTVIPVADHIEVRMPGVPATYYSEGLSDRVECENCGIIIGDHEVTPVVDVEIIYLPKDVRYIMEQAFLNDNIQCVVIPEGCLEIHSEAFANNKALMFADLPSTLTFIDQTAFKGCDNELIIIAKEGSLAQSYAESRGITCVVK